VENLFRNTMEQLSSPWVGSKQKRRHARAVQTPARRLLATVQLYAGQRKWIEICQTSNNPFEMKTRIGALLAQVWEQLEALLVTGEEESPGFEGEAGLVLEAIHPLRHGPASTATQTIRKPIQTKKASMSG